LTLDFEIIVPNINGVIKTVIPRCCSSSTYTTPGHTDNTQSRHLCLLNLCLGISNAYIYIDVVDVFSWSYRLLSYRVICNFDTNYTNNSFHHDNTTHKQTTSMSPCVSLFQYAKDVCHMSCKILIISIFC
jgi:hypothetical protein